jgi:hypothetical protein
MPVFGMVVAGLVYYTYITVCDCNSEFVNPWAVITQQCTDPHCHKDCQEPKEETE